MKNLVVSCILFFCTLQTFGQQEYFIYLQTDNSQPFYIRINNNVYSSSSTGYFILSKLADSTASVTIGFPKTVFPEQQFNIPVNHKDAGYTLKTSGDKGWSLFNLQNQQVIMNGNPPEEKKNPEITGTRKNDSFSLLLANAVNDTAVLYTVNRPPKPAPVVVVAEEKKKDTLSLVKKELPQKDSISLVKKLPEKKDNSSTAKRISPHQRDTSTTAKTHLPGVKRPAVVAKNRKPVHDTAMVVKNTAAPPANLTQKDTTVKVDTASTAKNHSGRKKDTMLVTRNTHLPAAKEQPALAKNNKERKDTIIMMNGRARENNRSVAKNTSLKKEKAPFTQPGKDSLQVIKKEILQAPEEKRGALLNNKSAVVVEKVPVKRDTIINNAGAKKDTIEILTKNEPVKQPETTTDTPVSPPAKRLRPLVTKAAELLTDTSYIAVFVDESKEKFDTIRISIPFNEAAAYARQKPAVKPVDTVTEKPIKDSDTAVIANQPVPTVIKNDTAAARPLKDSPVVTITQNIPPSVKTDSAIAVPPPVVKKDSMPGNNASKESIPVTANREPAPVPVKKDSVPAADSGRETKAPAQPLFLNSDCKEIAFDSDIDKLRIKMLLVVSDEDRISLAKRLFKQKCILVKQVRALSELFKSDEGKYKWFDASYPYVSDTGNFSSLGELIKDDYYLNRFKAMLRH